MQISRMFEMVHLLLKHGKMTAPELARHFEVSVRTIYRDIEALSAAGIPIYTNQGKHGGIELMEQFVLDRTLLSKKEQQTLLASVQGLGALHVASAERALTKLGALFGKAQPAWLEVDFSHWGSDSEGARQFEQIRDAILERKILDFLYCNALGEVSERRVEPEKLLFKDHCWYLYGYCHRRQAPRLFRLTRMHHVEKTEVLFERRKLPDPSGEFRNADAQMVHLKCSIKPSAAYRVYDCFPPQAIEKQPDGSFLVTVSYPPGEWVIGFALSFGADLEVLEPVSLRQELCRRAKSIAEKYEDMH